MNRIKEGRNVIGKSENIEVCIYVFSDSERAASILPFTVLPLRVDANKAEFNDIIFSLYDISTIIDYRRLWRMNRSADSLTASARTV